MFERVDLAAAIKKLRGGRTQKEVAQRAGIDETAWSLYENEGRQPTLKSLAKVAHGLGCTMARLEEEIWEARNRRLAEAQTLAARKDLAGEPDPLRHQLHEHFAGIAHHVHEIMLLVKDQKPPGGGKP